MKRNRIVTLIAGMVLSTTLAVSSPLTAFGTDFFDDAGAGDTETYEDSMYVGADEYSEDDYTDEDYSEDDYSGELDGSGDMEEPAAVYTVTYDLNGHGESYTEDVEEGYPAEGIADYPMDDGYEFLGWFTDKKCQTPWDGAVTSNMTVYAGWEQIPQEPEEPEVVEEPEVIETPEQTEDAGSGETEGTEEAAGAAGQEEGTGADGTSDQAAPTEDGNTAPSENTASAGTTAQEIAEEGDEETASEEAADAGDEDADSIFKTQPKEEVTVKESEKAEFIVELKENLEGIDYSKITYQWFKETDGGEGEDEEEGENGEEAEETAVTGNDSAKTAKFVIESVKKEDEGSYFCRVSHDGQPLEDSDEADLTVTPDLTAMSQPQDQTVEYPAGVTFSVPSSDSAKYQWYIHDKSTGKDVKLDGESATTATLNIPSTTKDDDGQKFYCEISEGGKTVKSEKATLKISNKDKNKPVLYIGNYALDLSKDAVLPKDSDGTNRFYINDTAIAMLDEEKENAVGNHDKNFIEFDFDKKIITFNNVHVINTNAVYDHKYSPAVGIYLSGTGEKEYTINLVGTNKITLTKLESVRDDKASALRFNSGDSKKKSETKIKGKGTLTTKSGKTAIVSDGDLDISTTITVNHVTSDTILNGIECENLNLNKGADLTADVYGTGVYAHDKFKMESGAKATLQSYVYKPPVKDAVLYAGKKISIDGAVITVIANPGDECTVKTFSGIESAGDIVISGDSNVKVNAPCAVYGIKAAGELSLKDSDMNVTAGPADGTSKAYGVVCGSSKISLSKEAKYTVQCKVADGIAFAALTGESGNKEKGYQEKYTPKKITFETADILFPYAHEISTGSIKDGSKYVYVETVYKMSKTTEPVISTGVSFESTKHEWGDPTYTWSKDNSTVKAQVVCKNYKSHKLTETVKTTSKKTKEATCTEKAQTTYTAVFKNNVFEKQTKTVDTGKALGHKFGEWVVITRPTLTATGEKKHTCERCKKVETAVIPKLTKGTYKVTKGASLEWTKGSGKSLEVKVVRETKNSTAFSHFQGILVDGKVLKKEYYKAKSGSVIITFKKDFLSKLGVGTHTLTYGFEDGDNPKSTLVIKNVTSSSNSSKTSSGTSGKGTTSAKTGDTTNIFLWVLTLCAAGAAVVLIQRYKKNNKKKDQDKDKGSDSGEK